MIYRNTTAIEAVNEGRDTPDAYYHPKHPSELIATSKWHATDAWRGYHELTPEPGYKLLDSSWLTGDWDDAPAGHSDNEVAKQIEQLEAEHGDIFVIYTPTSNVFSTSFDVLVRDPAKPVNKGKAAGVKTRLFTEPDGSFRVRYHATDVISWNAATDKYTLNSGGWHTMTTAKRMNEYLPSYRGYVCRRNWELKFVDADGVYHDLIDGMEV